MLINCSGYKDGKKDKDLNLEDIKHWLDQESNKSAFAWLAFKDPEESELNLAALQLNLPDLALEDALHGDQRAKIEEYGTQLFMSLKQIELSGNEVKTGELYIFAGPNHAISVRKGDCNGFSLIRQRVITQPELIAKGPAFVVYSLTDMVIDRYFPVLEILEQRFYKLEKQIFESNDNKDQTRKEFVKQLWALKDEVGDLRHQISPLLEATGKLVAGRVPPICVGFEAYFRDARDHLMRIVDDLDRLKDSIMAAMQANLSLVAIEESHVTKRLAAWAAIFGASTVMAGIWGMNFKHMPELEWLYGYPLALCSILIVAGFLRFKFKKSGWM